MTAILIAAILVAAIAFLSIGVLLCAVVVVLGTIRKTKWGINPVGSLECPRCHTVQGAIRLPRSMRAALWGGYTCHHCGTEVDKWNRPVSGV
jgi:hypothetical protein